MARGDQRRDPLIALRIPEALDQRLRAEARARDSTISEIVRGAIETSLATPTPAKLARVIARRDTCTHRVRTGNYCRRCERVI